MDSYRRKNNLALIESAVSLQEIKCVAAGAVIKVDEFPNDDTRGYGSNYDCCLERILKADTDN